MTYTINTITKFAKPLVVSSQIGPSGVQFGRILYYKTNREALTVLFSVIKHLGSG